MRLLIAATALAMCPLQAFSDEADADCLDTWQNIVAFIAPVGDDIDGAVVDSRKAGWCAVSATLGIDEINAMFRVDQLTEAPQGARSIEVTLERVYIGPEAFDVTAAVSYDSATGALQLHDLTASAFSGRGLRARANMRLTDWDNGADFLSLLPALMAERASLAMSVNPGMMQESGINLRQVTPAVVEDAFGKVSERQISRRARSEFLRFIRALPNASGKLELTVDIPDGRPVLHIAGALGSFGRNEDNASALAAVLTDTTVDIAWNPGRM
jgi:hypothetical protein